MPCGHSSGLSNRPECAIYDPHSFHIVQSVLTCNLGFFHKEGMFSRQIHSRGHGGRKTEQQPTSAYKEKCQTRQGMCSYTLLHKSLPGKLSGSRTTDR